MDIVKYWKPILTVLIVIFIILIITSVANILISAVFIRFYTDLTFIVIFGVGGIFAGLVGYSYGIERATEKDALSKWVLIITLIISGLLFFFYFSGLDESEYETAFKAYGAALIISCLYIAKSKDEISTS